MSKRPDLGAFEMPLAELLGSPLWAFMKAHIGAEVEDTTSLLIQSPEVRNPPYGDEWIRGRINGLPYMALKFESMIKAKKIERESSKEADPPPPIGSILEHPVE